MTPSKQREKDRHVASALAATYLALGAILERLDLLEARVKPKPKRRPAKRVRR